MSEIILTEHAPKPIGPYSQAVRSGNLVFLSGQIPLDPESGSMAQGIEAQTRQVLENIKAVLEAAGSGLGRALKVNVYMTDLTEFVRMNEIYGQYFRENPPARATFQVAALPRGARIEIDVVAEV